MPAKKDAKKSLAANQGNLLNFVKTLEKATPRIAKQAQPSVIVIADDDDNEDIIPPSPEKHPIPPSPERHPPKPAKQDVLTNITNAGPAHSTLLDTENPPKKRKGCYPDDIPEMDVQMPQRKKPCSVKEGVRVVSLADVSAEEFQEYQMGLALKSPKVVKMLMKTPEKGPVRSPKKRTPIKLFEQSPAKANNFKVEILQNFVKVTPSNSGANQWVDVQKPKSKSSEKKQVQKSILEFASPKASNTSQGAKNANEKTPVNVPSHSGSTPKSGTKAKVKLDFTLSNTFTTFLPVAQSTLTDSKKTPVKKLTPTKRTPRKSPFEPDLFEDSWDEQFEAAAEYTLNLNIAQHCKVSAISTTRNTINLELISTKTDEKALCVLTGLWINSLLDVGSTVYVQAEWIMNEWRVDNQHGLLVFEPDYLVSSTTIANGLFCKRQSVLKERFGGFAPKNKAMLVGGIVHSLLQEALRKNFQSESAIALAARQLVTSRDIIFSMFPSSFTIPEIDAEVAIYIPRILTFMRQYLARNAGKYPVQLNSDDWRGKIDDVCDIEENIWCPELGVKGKIDVSVRVGDSVLPLELKTGKASMSLQHRGQVLLYIMLMNKIGYKVSSGLLLYLKEGILRDVSLNMNEKRDLVMFRNEVVYYLTRQPKVSDRAAQDFTERSIGDIEELMPANLPPPINHHSACKGCEYNTLCLTYLKREEYNIEEYPHLMEMRESVVGHLSRAHVKYFNHWCALLALEANTTEGKSVRDIYTKSPEVRESAGCCLMNMKLEVGAVIECNGIYTSTFVKQTANCKHGNLLAAGIGESNYVIISTRKRPAVASGIVTHLDYKAITIELDRDLSKKFVNTMFIIDTYDSMSSTTFYFTNLSILLEPDDRSKRMCELIIDKATPNFKEKLPTAMLSTATPVLVQMNEHQQRAIVMAMTAKDYLMIKGMPGTGKTATLVALVQLLVKQNYSVLITSHTNSAVDNLCLRLLRCGINLMRLGAASRIHPDLQQCSEHHLTRDCTTPEEISEIYNKAKVIAVTCLSSKHPLLSMRTMDFCIVDESTQVLQCSVLRPLHASTVFVLVGDPDQLPPVVRNRQALEHGMSESLFERLANGNERSKAIVTLRMNYRMNKTITALANKITYKGQLLIANDKVGNANLRIPTYESMAALHNDEQWLLNALSDELDKAVILLDTGPVWNKNRTEHKWLQPGEDEKEYNTCVNPSECAIITVLVHALLKGGVCASNIGVIAPYRAQVAQLSSLLSSHGIDVNTVDQFQGKDKEVILYSCTKSRDISQPKRIYKFDILEDQRRLTVAVTRAKHKFIMLADVSTMREYAPFGGLIKHVNHDAHMQLIDGEMGFHWKHVFEECNKHAPVTF